MLALALSKDVGSSQASGEAQTKEVKTVEFLPTDRAYSSLQRLLRIDFHFTIF